MYSLTGICEFHCRDILRKTGFDSDRKVYYSELKVLYIENSLW